VNFTPLQQPPFYEFHLYRLRVNPKSTKSNLQMSSNQRTNAQAIEL